MHLERYEFEIFGNRYIFYSEGPKGMIQKAILYQMVRGGRRPLYNLTFGDNFIKHQITSYAREKNYKNSFRSDSFAYQ